MIVTSEPVSGSSTLVTPSSPTHKFLEDEKKPWSLGILRNFNRDLALLLHPDEDLGKFTPKVKSIIPLVFIFIGFAAVLAVAARLPVEAMRWIVVSLGSVSFIWTLFILRKDYWRNGHQVYRTNLGNTALTVLITVPLFTILYALLWFGNLRSEILVTTTDTVQNVRYPSVALFQEGRSSSQANLLGTGSKCFLGWFNATAPLCSDLTIEESENAVNCQCQNMWETYITENFEWQGANYRYLAFEAAAELLDNTPTHSLLLQTFFDYNGTKAYIASSVEQSPSLMMAVYDPGVGLQTSLDAGYTRMFFISANGIVSVNINLRTRQVSGYPPAYDYDLSFSSSPVVGNIVCDVSLPEHYPCFLTLFLQIPSFQRENIRPQKVMGWLDMAASAGAYFSFVQFLSWILSAQAFAT